MQISFLMENGAGNTSFKKNDELSKDNYRPVTVLQALNNLFEKLLASQLDQFYSEILSVGLHLSL